MTARTRTNKRTCIVTRQILPAGEMLRFVCGPDGTLIFDIKARLPGRGVWVSATRSHLERALKKGLFARALKTDIKIAPDLVSTTEQQLRASALGSFGLARKAGQIITGFANVEAAIRKGGIAALVHASDCAEDGRRKLANAVRGVAPELRPRETVLIFTSNELSLALGRSNVIHAAAMEGHAGEMFAGKAHMLANFYRDGAPEPSGRDTRISEPQSHEAAL